MSEVIIKLDNFIMRHPNVDKIKRIKGVYMVVSGLSGTGEHLCELVSLAKGMGAIVENTKSDSNTEWNAGWFYPPQETIIAQG